jgi:hypothetical protein
VLLDDKLIDTVHRLQVATLRVTAEAYERVLPSSVGGEIGTGFALFAGEGSPLTQVFGFAHRTPGDPAEIERFYADRAQNWEVTVTPFTSPETLQALTNLGYRPSHFEGSLAQKIDHLPEPAPFDIDEVGEGDAEWMETTWRGWTGDESGPFQPDDLVRAVAVIRCRRYLARIDGAPAATASLFEFPEGVILGGAATRIPFRGRGLQSALLARRLRDAGQGRLALMGAVPGTTSHRNAQRAGFHPIYSTMVWMRR